VAGANGTEEAAHQAVGRSPIGPEFLVREIHRAIPPEAIVVADASYSSIWMANGLPARASGQRFLSPRGLAGLGWGLPMALGAKVARPEAPVVAIVGDGGFGHCWSELETAVRSRIAVTLIVLNNGILGYQKHSELHQFGKHTDAIEFGNVDHAGIAIAVGATGWRVSAPEEVRPRFTEALQSDTVCVLDVLVEPDAWPPITAWDADPALAAVTAGKLVR
jgi:acetolactate synthase-1/2/3 large subunit